MFLRSATGRIGTTMISIKRFLEQRRVVPEVSPDVVEALMQLSRLLLDAMATHTVRGNEADFRTLSRTLKDLERQITGPPSAMTLLGISSAAIEALETYCRQTDSHMREQREQRQCVIAMLTDTVAELSGHTNASLSRLQAIEEQLERTSALDDIRVLRANLADNLLALREAAAQQRSRSLDTIERLQNQIARAREQASETPKQHAESEATPGLIPEASSEPAHSVSNCYVAAFRLQRADHIASRFGERVRHEMLSTIAAQLKSMLGPTDRLLRWKGTSFVMFINSTGSIQDVKASLNETISATGQQYIEVGRKSALLSVGVDWIVFPQAERPSLEEVFAEIDAFLANQIRPSPLAPHR